MLINSKFAIYFNKLDKVIIWKCDEPSKEDVINHIVDFVNKISKNINDIANSLFLIYKNADSVDVTEDTPVGYHSCLYIKDDKNCLKIYDSFGSKAKLIKVVYYKKPIGNCVDRLLQYDIIPFLNEASIETEYINERANERASLSDYRNTSLYERDFSKLCMIRDYCNRIANKINRHLENITVAEY